MSTPSRKRPARSSRSRYGIKKLAMNGNDPPADSVENNGRRRSGSVSSILRSTSCSSTCRCADTEPAPQQLDEVGGVLHAIAELGEEPGDLPRHRLPQQLVPTAGEVAVDRGPRDARCFHHVLDGGLAHAEAGDARVGRLEQSVDTALRAVP